MPCRSEPGELSAPTTWLQIDIDPDEGGYVLDDAVSALGKSLHLHPATEKDITERGHLPKVELVAGSTLVVVLRYAAAEEPATEDADAVEELTHKLVLVVRLPHAWTSHSVGLTSPHGGVPAVPATTTPGGGSTSPHLMPHLLPPSSPLGVSGDHGDGFRTALAATAHPPPTLPMSSPMAAASQVRPRHTTTPGVVVAIAPVATLALFAHIPLLNSPDVIAAASVPAPAAASAGGGGAGSAFDATRASTPDSERSQIGVTSPLHLCNMYFDDTIESLRAAVARVSERVDRIERVVVTVLHDRRDYVRTLYLLRRRAAVYRRVAMLTRECALRYARAVQLEADPFFVDVEDSADRLVFEADAVHSAASELLALQLSLFDYRTNKLLYALTVVSVTLMPATFLTGLFGTNFDSLPLIHTPNAFYGFCALLFAVAAGTLLLLRRLAFF